MVADSEKASSEILKETLGETLGARHERPTKDRQVRFWWILGGSFVCQCLVLQFYRWFPWLHGMMSPDSNLGTLLISLYWGTLASLSALIAFWTVWGSVNLPLRLLFTFGFALVVANVFGFNKPGPIPMWTIVILLQLLLGCYVILLFATAWLTKLSLQDSQDSAALPKAAQTYSLKYLGAWGIVFAVLLAVSRAMIGNRSFNDLFPDQAMVIEGIVVFSILFAANFLLASPLILSILSSGWWKLRVLGSLAAVVPITLLENSIMNQIPGGAAPFQMFLCMNAVQLVWVILTFGLLRWTGFRLMVAQARA